jgi:alpha-beta hydrolase superfamily lysophospholipase
MAEHARRYDDFAAFLNKNGFLVFADDHRAHGNSVKKGGLGYAEGDVFEDTVKDEIFITDYLAETYKLPVVVVGHSYGSFLTQRYIECDGKAAGVLLSGSACMAGALLNVGNTIANCQSKIFDGKKKAKLLDGMSVGGYDKKFKKEKTKFAWLSRDTAVGKKYFFDEHCGFTMSIAFYKSFFNGLKTVYQPENLAKIAKDQKLAIFSGTADPVGGKNAVLVKKLYEQYKALGLSPALKLYDNARHEILNETNKSEVYADFLAAIDSMV